ncbi:MAG: hypothetical protein MUC96_07545 [Myxococcaceae bacterium]|jgi:hypothetical protein|nr:hypothetical protein [Myxococcaceae bacterium]
MLSLTTALVLVLSQTGPDKVVDVSAKKADFGVLTDGKGHYVVYNAKEPLSGPTFYGDGKTFNLLRVIGGGASGTESWDMSLWDPRVVGLKQSYASMSMKDEGKTFELTCGETTGKLTRLGKDEATKLVDAAAFRGSKWTRQPTLLYRDDTGSYYLIDRLRTDDDNDRRDWRVFVGPRGKMKLAALKDVVDDDQGQIFATKDGSLRLVTKTGETKWIKGKAETVLTEVDLGSFRNARMVYVDLGPYVGQKLGTPCDDLL